MYIQLNNTFKRFARHTCIIAILYGLSSAVKADELRLNTLKEQAFELLNNLLQHHLETNENKVSFFKSNLLHSSDRSLRTVSALGLSAWHVGKKQYQEALYFLNLANDMVEPNPTMTPIIAIQRLVILFETGNFSGALKYAKSLEKYDKSLGNSLSFFRNAMIVESLFKLKKYNELIEFSSAFQNKYPNSFPRNSELNALVAKSYIKTKTFNSNLNKYLENASKSYPFTESSVWAFETLEKFSCNSNVKSNNPSYQYSESLLFELARNATNNPDMKIWIQEKLTLPLNKGYTSNYRMTEQERLAFLIDTRMYHEAYNLSKTILNNLDNRKYDRPKLLLQAARAASETQHDEEAISLYKLHAKEFYDGNLSAKTSELVGYAFLRLGRYDEAAQAFSYSAMRGGPDYVRWQHFWSYYRGKHWKSALSLLEQDNYLVSQDPTEPTGLFYWKARILEQLDQKDKAKEYYANLLSRDPDGFYASLVNNKIPDLQPMIAEEKTSLTASLMTTFRFPMMNPNSINLKETPYPLVYEDYVNLASSKLELDRYLVFSIMRAESRFAVNATSSVGARGLLQIMPYTSAKIASDINHHQFSLADLESPEVNISYGSYYLAYLLKIFGNNPLVATAAYNAGPHAVNRWLERCQTCTIDEFVESIPYRETRRYVKEVFRNYRAYLRTHEPTERITMKWDLPKPVEDTSILY